MVSILDSRPEEKQILYTWKLQNLRVQQQPCFLLFCQVQQNADIGLWKSKPLYKLAHVQSNLIQ